MTERWRCFVAVPLPDDLRAALRSAVEAWRDAGIADGLRWSDPDGWHVTLAFLGSVEATEVGGLVDRLEASVRDHAPSELETGGLGGFPSAARARVAWYGVADPERHLRRLASDVRSAMDVDATPFRAHVTLGRARSAPVDLRPWLAAARPPAGRLVVDRVELMRSHLGRGPARYEVLATVPLGVPVGV